MKRSILLFVVVSLTLVLSSCGGSADQDQTPLTLEERMDTQEKAQSGFEERFSAIESS